MPALPYNDTAVVDRPWDGPGNEAAIPNTAGRSTLRQMYAWVSPDGDPDAKASYKLPHHEVSGGRPGAANVNGVRNALARLPQTTGIPRGDFDAIRSHLNRHLSKFNAGRQGHAEDLALQGALVVEANAHVWAIRRECLEVLADLHGHVASDAMYASLLTGPEGGPGPTPNNAGVAVLPLKGVLMPQVSLISLLFGGGGSGLLAFRSALRQAGNDPAVKSIVLDVDSPGGYVDLIPETAAEIRAVADRKPVVAVANTMAASAAYWLASQAHELIASPSAEVGSIGVYTVHMDQSKRYEMAGVKPTIVKAGAFKTEGNPYEPLTDEARDYMREQVNDYYDQFTGDVAKGRGVPQEDVIANYGEGRTFTARRAKSAGLVDRVATLEDTVARLSSGRARLLRTAESDAAPVLVWDEEGTPAPIAHAYSQEETDRVLTTLARLR